MLLGLIAAVGVLLKAIITKTIVVAIKSSCNENISLNGYNLGMRTCCFVEFV